MINKNTTDIEKFEAEFIKGHEHEDLPVGWNDMFTLPNGQEVYCFSEVREALELWNSK